MTGMNKEDQKRYLKICGVYEYNYEAVYKSAASDVVNELISRFYKDVPEERYMTDFELLNYGIGAVRFSELHIYSFLALVCRLALKKGFVVVSLPCIDPKESDSMSITIKGYRYRAVPIYVEESEIW